MARAEQVAAGDVLTIERAAAACDAQRALPVARAVFEHAGAEAETGCGREAAIVASLCVATRRSDAQELELEAACGVLNADPDAVALAVGLLEGALSPPASEADVRALRRTIIAVNECLAALENGRRNPPRIPPSTIADPALARLANGTLEDVDEAELRAHLRRLEADCRLARLGVDLYTLLEGE